MKSRIPPLETFIKERNAALFSFDEERIRAYMRKYGAPIPNNPKVFWGGVCKAVCAITNAPEQAKEKARAWLKEHNMTEEIGYEQSYYDGQNLQ